MVPFTGTMALSIDNEISERQIRNNNLLKYLNALTCCSTCNSNTFPSIGLARTLYTENTKDNFVMEASSCYGFEFDQLSSSKLIVAH